MPSRKRHRASSGESPPPRCEWWSHGGQGGSIDGLADRGSLMLANLLGLPLANFNREYWLKKPYLKQLTAAQRAGLPRSHPARMLPMDDVKALLRRRQPRPTRYTHDVDVTRYVNGRRAALSEGSGEIDADEVWGAFESRGYSIRIVHPQQWHQARSVKHARSMSAMEVHTRCVPCRARCMLCSAPDSAHCLLSAAHDRPPALPGVVRAVFVPAGALRLPGGLLRLPDPRLRAGLPAALRRRRGLRAAAAGLEAVASRCRDHGPCVAGRRVGAAQAAAWPRLAEDWGRLGRALALEAASGAPAAGRGLSRLVVRIGGACTSDPTRPRRPPPT